MTGHLLLLDVSGFAYRAFATSNPVHRPSDGEPIGAVLRYMEMVWRLLGDAQADKPTHGAAVFDCNGKYFRHGLYPAYKGKRDPARSLILDGQMPFLKHASETLGFHPVEVDGFEADDVMATLGTLATKAGIRTTLVSSDKDLAQLAVDGEVEIFDPIQKRRVLAADIEAKWGVPPRLMAEMQALAGDTVDGIPGIKGCGVKSAGGLLRRFGSLNAVLKNASECRQASLRHELMKPESAKLARLCLKLTTLRRDVDIPIGLDALLLESIMKSHLKEILRALEAPQYMEAIFALDPQMARVVEHDDDPYAWWAEEVRASGQPVPMLPQAGFYKRKLVKGGAFVPARIWREPHIDVETGKADGIDVLRCEVDGRARDPFAEWVRLSMNPIKRSEFNFETADIAHAKAHRPNDAKHDVTKRVNILTAPVPKLNRRR